MLRGCSLSDERLLSLEVLPRLTQLDIAECSGRVLVQVCLSPHC